MIPVLSAYSIGVTMRSVPFRRRSDRERSRGQSLAEFALVFPVLMLILGGIIQFGILFWGQNTLTQVARDTGRWAASQVTCPTTGTVTPVADSIAASSSLIGYTSPADLTVTAAMSGDPCPVTDNQQVAYVTITLTHRVPVFFPWIPGDGNLTTSAQFRMEPTP
jgi:Flp pilus assembly protein TadG